MRMEIYGALFLIQLALFYRVKIIHFIEITKYSLGVRKLCVGFIVVV